MEKLRRKLLTVLAILLPFAMQAQDQEPLGLSVTVHVSEPGTLFVKIQEQIEELGEMSDVTSLTVTGQLNEDDTNVLRWLLTNLQKADFSGLSPESGMYIVLADKPSLVEVKLPMQATQLGGELFSNCENLTAVTLPTRLEAVPYACFANCKKLTTLDIPATVVEVGEHAFSACESLATITLPEGLQTIGYSAFYGCSSLKSITLPSTLQVIYDGAFAECGLETLTLPAGVKIDAPEGDGVFHHCKQLRSVTLPDGLTDETDLGVRTFIGCESLAQVRLPQTLTTIPEECFAYTALSTLQLPPTLTKIGSGAFCGCKNMTAFTVPTTVTSIGNGVFQESGLQRFSWPSQITTIPTCTFSGCTDLKSITIPATVQSIGAEAFRFCSSLTSISFPEGVSAMPYLVCEGCSSLTQASIPSTVTSIGGSAFFNCNLSHVSIPDGVTSIDIFAFGGNPLEEVNLPSQLKHLGSYAFAPYNGGGSLGKFTSVVVPEGVITMGSSVFSSENLKEIDLPSTLIAIGEMVLADNLQIEKLTVRAALPPFHNGQLLGNDEQRATPIFVPAKSVNLYKADADGFGEATDIRPLNIDPRTITIVGHVDWNKDNPLQDGKYDVTFQTINDMTTYMVNSDDHPRLTVGEDARLQAGTISFTTDVEAEWWFTNYRWDSFINRGTVSADCIDHRWRMKDNHFFTPAFDLKVGDIQPEHENSSFAIFRYDTEARAKADFDHTWVKMRRSETLKAGVGYAFKGVETPIAHGDNGEWTKVWDFFHFPSQATGTNYFLANDDITLPLQHYTGEFPHNSNWNLVGMPYPSYLDIRGLDYDGPVIAYVSGEKNWRAMSALDDEALLNPLSAFFIQAPAGVNDITFSANRRQHSFSLNPYYTPQNSPIALRRADKNAQRVVYDATMLRHTEQGADDNQKAHTRFVINPDATLRYDIGRDAPLFSDADKPTNQLYTQAEGLAYAINERPLADGIVRLGMQVAEGGTYTLSLRVRGEASPASQEVWLYDNEEHTRTLLNDSGSYTFTVAEAGTLADRFVIAFGDADPTAVSDVTVALPLRSDGLFNLAGQKIENRKASSGVFIENGKKVIK